MPSSPSSPESYSKKDGINPQGLSPAKAKAARLVLGSDFKSAPLGSNLTLNQSELAHFVRDTQEISILKPWLGFHKDRLRPAPRDWVLTIQSPCHWLLTRVSGFS